MVKIMIVDDERDIRESTKAVLQPRGYEVVLAQNADECLALAKTEHPDLILMDLLMPGTPVEEVLPKLKSTKVIIFSVVTMGEKYVAETGEKYPNPYLFSNVVDTISKPVNIKELLAKIKKALS